MTLSVIVPILNEETFVPLYLESVAAFADEIIIVDGEARTEAWSILPGWRQSIRSSCLRCRRQVFPIPRTGTNRKYGTF